MNDTDLADVVKRFGPVRSLAQLLHRAGLDQYAQGQWFRDAELKPPYLYVNDDRATVRYLRNKWGSEFQRHIPGLEIRPRLKTERPAPAKVTRFPSLKPGRVRDLLDDEDA